MDKRLRIGLISKFLPEKDGIARFSEDLASEINRLGHQVIKVGDVRSHADVTVDFQSWRLKEQFDAIVKRYSLDVLHIQYIPAYFGRKTCNLNLLRALKQDVPVVVTLHEVYYEDTLQGMSLLRKKGLPFLERKVIAASGMIITHTAKQKEFLTAKYGLGSDKIVSIPLGLKPQPLHVRKGKNVLFLGIISRDKGVEPLIEAMHLLPDCKLKIVGRFLDEVHKAQIEGQVKLHPNIDTDFRWVTDEQRWGYLKWADIGILPYRRAHQSGVLNDAAAVGIPVVVTRVGALHEAVEQFGFGEIIAPTPQAIAQAVSKIFSDYIDYQRKLSAYRDVACWENVSAATVQVYVAAIQRKRGD